MGLELGFPASPGDCSASWGALQAQKYFSLAVLLRTFSGSSCQSEGKLPSLTLARHFA